MQLPIELQEAIDCLTQSLSTKHLREAREKISADYREGKSSLKAFQQEAQLFSYLVTRMPATYAANAMVFRAIRERYPQFQCRSFLDLGAGPGTASWAALETFPELLNLCLVEREAAAIEVGKKLTLNKRGWERAEWRCASLDEKCRIESADLAVLSYIMAELPKEKSLALIDRLFEENISLVAIIEPGTPKGFERIRFFREYVLQKGAQIIAPCPHHFACPMPASDWCHFSARVERTRLHRQLKGGSLGHEDEKYSYIVYGKKNFPIPAIEGRVIRSPHKGSGFVRLPLCAQSGILKEVTITRNNKEMYRAARDAEWGSILN